MLQIETIKEQQKTGLCPFHEDHSPSLVISPKKNLWNCLGACRRGGDVIEWVMRAEGVSFRHAVELLREDHFPLAASSRPVKSSSVPKLPAPVSRDADDRALLLQVVSYYQETLKETPEALRYLESRGLKSGEMVERGSCSIPTAPTAPFFDNWGGPDDHPENSFSKRPVKKRQRFLRR
jgi:DNA primase